MQKKPKPNQNISSNATDPLYWSPQGEHLDLFQASVCFGIWVPAFAVGFVGSGSSF